MTCGLRREEAALTELHAHDGPTFEHWRRAVAASVGAALVDTAGKSA